MSKIINTLRDLRFNLSQPISIMLVYFNTDLYLAVKTFRGTLAMFRILDYIRVKGNFFLEKRHVSFSRSLELADIEHKVQAGMFVSQIFTTI